MRLLLDSFWRALAHCLHPRVIGWSLLPLVVMALGVLALGWWLWDPAVEGVREWLDASALMSSVSGWLVRIGLEGLKAMIAPLIVIFAVTPLVVIGSLLLVLVLMSPALVSFVAQRRFSHLERLASGGWWRGLLWALGSTAMALFALLVSLPLWLIPPLVLVIPPLVWGWLAYRVLAFDALSIHATPDERRELMREHRISLLFMGLLAGYIGAAPSLVWAFGAAVLVPFFVILVPLAIWIYTFAFAFSALWFSHYCLGALDARRRDAARARGASGGGVVVDASAPSPAALAAPPQPPALP